jgi:hypothetical protein
LSSIEIRIFSVCSAFFVSTHFSIFVILWIYTSPPIPQFFCQKIIIPLLQFYSQHHQFSKILPKLRVYLHYNLKGTTQLIKQYFELSFLQRLDF